MNRVSVLVCGFFASAMLVGCGQEQTTTEAASSSASVKAGSVEASLPAKAMLQVVPGTVDSCEVGATIDPIISWRRIDPLINSTRVTTDNPANPEERLFAKAGFGGSAKAGNWVVAGTKFHLYDDATGTELASYTVTTTTKCTN